MYDFKLVHKDGATLRHACLLAAKDNLMTADEYNRFHYDNKSAYICCASRAVAKLHIHSQDVLDETESICREVEALISAMLPGYCSYASILKKLGINSNHQHYRHLLLDRMINDEFKSFWLDRESQEEPR